MPTRILLAESDEVLRASLAEQLEREGYDVAAAAGAEEARNLVREPCGFAIIGLSDGEQLAEMLRSEGLACPILLIVDAEASPTLEYLTRPFRFSALLGRLHALNNHHAPADDAAVFFVGHSYEMV